MTEAPAPSHYEPIALANESTIVAEFVRPSEVRDVHYRDRLLTFKEAV